MSDDDCAANCLILLFAVPIAFIAICIALRLGVKAGIRPVVCQAAATATTGLGFGAAVWFGRSGDVTERAMFAILASAGFIAAGMFQLWWSRHNSSQ